MPIFHGESILILPGLGGGEPLGGLKACVVSSVPLTLCFDLDLDLGLRSATRLGTWRYVVVVPGIGRQIIWLLRQFKPRGRGVVMVRNGY